MESSSAVASWKPPAEESIGGKLIGYKVCKNYHMEKLAEMPGVARRIFKTL